MSGIVIGVVVAGICLYLLVAGICLYLLYKRLLKLKDKRRTACADDGKICGVEADLKHLRRMITSKKNTQLIYAACEEYEHLSKVEGFSAVATLFKHRHRKRALDRLEIFCREWKENGLKLYGRI